MSVSLSAIRFSLSTVVSVLPRGLNTVGISKLGISGNLGKFKPVSDNTFAIACAGPI